MRYFICPLDGKNPGSASFLGIPAEKTERIISSNREQKTVCETENGDEYISLPVLLGQKDFVPPHGVILKTDNSGKTILLTPKIDIDTEIPEEGIHKLPEALSVILKAFRGAFCSDKKIIFILDTEKLLLSIRRQP